jgi:hypothetical protein
MTLTDLQTLIGSLCNDPNHDRYTTTDIGTELDNTQDDWNVKARVIKDTVPITLVDGTRQYLLSGLTGTPLDFPRVTNKGLDLGKRSKAWMDHASGSDWTATTGTPKYFVVEATDPSNLYLTLQPTPAANDAGAYLVVEYTKRHTPMSASNDTPFMAGTETNYLLRPYDWGLAYATSARLLTRDPNPENVNKIANYSKTGSNVLADVIQVFKALEAEEPKKLSGGRYWNSGYLRTSK